MSILTDRAKKRSGLFLRKDADAAVKKSPLVSDYLKNGPVSKSQLKRLTAQMTVPKNPFPLGVRRNSNPMWRLGQMFLLYRQDKNLSLQDISSKMSSSVSSGILSEFENGNQVSHAAFMRILDWMLEDDNL